MTTETVVDVLRDFDAMAAESGGLEAATIHAMTVRLSVANAREVEANDACIRKAGRRISKLASLLNQANVDRLREVEALRLRAEAAEGDARRLREALILARDEFNGLPRSLGYSITHLPAIDAAIASAT